MPTSEDPPLPKGTHRNNTQSSQVAACIKNKSMEMHSGIFKNKNAAGSCSILISAKAARSGFGMLCRVLFAGVERGGLPRAAARSQGDLGRGQRPPHLPYGIIEQFGLTFPIPAWPKELSRDERALLTFWVYFKHS